MGNPWEQREGESDKAYAAFCIYRDLGIDRSLEKVSKEITKSIPLLKRWSALNQWVQRVQLYDAHLDSVSLAVVEKGIAIDREAYRRRVQDEAQRIADEALKLIRKAMASEDINQMANGLSKGAAVWERARHIEGIALGIAVSVGGGG